mmetsp:Transcript_47971/g.111950  ORF Transcript_47971/g.111950 Transcript_47971/m.111950 type:complete len:323 (-) Transcript_47971:175-1143(-)
MASEEVRSDAVQLISGEEAPPPSQPEAPDRGPHYSQAQATFRFGGTGLSDGLFDCDIVECLCCMCNPTASCSYGPVRVRTDLKRMSFATWFRSTLIAVMWTVFMVVYLAVPLAAMQAPPSLLQRSEDLNRVSWEAFYDNCYSSGSHCNEASHLPLDYEKDCLRDEISTFWKVALPGLEYSCCEMVKQYTKRCECKDELAKNFVHAASSLDCDSLQMEAIQFQVCFLSWIALRDFLIVTALLVLFTLVKYRYRLKHGFPVAAIKACLCTGLFFLQLSRHVDRASGFLPMPSGHEGREVLVGDPVGVEMGANTDARLEDQRYDL